MSTKELAGEQIAKGTVRFDPSFDEYRITGYVPHAAERGMPPKLDVPLISHVEGGLYQGGCFNGVPLSDDFDFVLSLYPWEKYVLGSVTQRKEVRMLDSLGQAFDQVDELASSIAARLRKGETVLIHCQAGLNRSGLLAARVLMFMGHTGKEAIELLRSSRSPLVLCNEAFESWILSHD